MVRIIKPSFDILTPLDSSEIYRRIENAARTCYKSEHLICEGSGVDLVKKLVKRNHWAMIELAGMFSVRFICNRGFSHEMVRHRLASFAQESTRFCDYEGQLTVIYPPFELSDGDYRVWKMAMDKAELYYSVLRENGQPPQMARGVLPIDVKTEIVVGANLREWYHIFDLRCSNAAHPSMQQLMKPLLMIFSLELPEIFGELNKKYNPVV